MLSKAYLSSFCLLLTSQLSQALPFDLEARTTLPAGDCYAKRTGIHFSTYSACQIPSTDPMEHCPQSGVLVDPSMTHISSDYPTFPTIQQAIDSIPNNSRKYTILVMAGTYHEQLNVTRAAPLSIIGQTYDPLDRSKNLVTVIGGTANYPGRYTDNAFSSTLTVAPNLNASLTGSGPTGFTVPDDTPFGNTDFRVYNIDFRNTEFDFSNGPALAISVSRANAGLYYCGFYSYQDTVYIGKLGNAYFYRSEIAGQTDFLYGFGTAYISYSKLLMRTCGGGVTAWKGTNTTFENTYGVYISSSDVVAANSTIAAAMKGKCALGRSWNYLHRSIFMDCYMDASIRPVGYIPWGSTTDFSHTATNETFMAEYDSYGPGWTATGRATPQLQNGVPIVITRVLSDNDVKKYRKPEDVFMTPAGKKGDISWIDTQFYAY
ncbi:Pectinesterase [Dactylellina cionopaga]|nr:Pectinesterase [Dactylellina cionopaga]